MTFGAAQTSAGKIYKYNSLKWSFIVSMIIFESSILGDFEWEKAIAGSMYKS
jgi:hypothetical protein